MRARDILLEMVVRYRAPDGSMVIAHRDSLWVLSEDDDDTPAAVLDDIRRRTGLVGTTMRGLLDNARDSRPDIVTGYVEGGVLFVYAYHSAAHQQTNPQLRKVMQALGLHELRVGDTDSNADDIETTFDIGAVGQWPSTFYHGTSTRYLALILRQGLRPTRNSNWKRVNFRDRIFLTSHMQYALSQANSQTSGGERDKPILIETRIPDPAKIMPDLDVMATFYGKQHPSAQATGYSRKIKTQKWDRERIKNIARYSPGTDWTRSTGIIAYRGAIRPTFFTTVYFPGEEGSMTPDNAVPVDARDRDKLWTALDMVEDFGFYDPSYRPEE